MAYLKVAKPSDQAKLDLTQDAATHPVLSVALAAMMATISAASGALPAPQTDKHPVNFLCEPAEDQGPTSGCTAHALSQGVDAMAKARGYDLGFKGPPSPKHFYSCSGAIARATATIIGKPGPIADDGRQLADEIVALMTCGAVAMGPLAPDGRFSDATPENATDEPSLESIEQGVHDCLKGAHTVDLTAPNALDQCAAALDSGIVLYTGFDCGDTFENLPANDVCPATPPGDLNQGGHSIIAVSYRLNAAGKREWLIRNSWGPWMLAGNRWVDDSFMLGLWECWLLDVSLLQAAGKKVA